jgi:hypothetical protein
MTEVLFGYKDHTYLPRQEVDFSYCLAMHALVHSQFPQEHVSKRKRNH